MDLHFFQSQQALAVVTKDLVMFVYERKVHRYDLISEFGGTIEHVAFDSDRGRIALSCNRNILILSLGSSESGPVKEKEAVLERNCSCLSWTEDGESLLAGDKSGGVWLITLRTADQSGKIVPKSLCSRIAVILALSVCGSGNEKFVAVGDRDGRLSFFHYPASHNLHSVALGHTQFIAVVTVPDRINNPHNVLSVGGDGLVCLWNVPTGTCVAKLELFTKNEDVSSDDRPKSLLLIKSKSTECNCQKFSWLIFGEHSSKVYGVSLSVHAGSCSKESRDSHSVFELVKETFEDLAFFPSAQDVVISAATTVNSNLLLVPGAVGKSVWPWECRNLNNPTEFTTDVFKLLKELEAFIKNNSLDIHFSLRPPRSWLERRPIKHIAEYYAKRRKTADVKKTVEASESSDSDD